MPSSASQDERTTVSSSGALVLQGNVHIHLQSGLQATVVNRANHTSLQIASADAGSTSSYVTCPENLNRLNSEYEAGYRAGIAHIFDRLSIDEQVRARLILGSGSDQSSSSSFPPTTGAITSLERPQDESELPKPTQLPVETMPAIHRVEAYVQDQRLLVQASPETSFAPFQRQTPPHLPPLAHSVASSSAPDTDAVSESGSTMTLSVKNNIAAVRTSQDEHRSTSLPHASTSTATDAPDKTTSTVSGPSGGTLAPSINVTLAGLTSRDEGALHTVLNIMGAPRNRQVTATAASAMIRGFPEDSARAPSRTDSPATTVASTQTLRPQNVRAPINNPSSRPAGHTLLQASSRPTPSTCLISPSIDRVLSGGLNNNNDKGTLRALQCITDALGSPPDKSYLEAQSNAFVHMERRHVSKLQALAEKEKERCGFVRDRRKYGYHREADPLQADCHLVLTYPPIQRKNFQAPSPTILGMTEAGLGEILDTGRVAILQLHPHAYVTETRPPPRVAGRAPHWPGDSQELSDLLEEQAVEVICERMRHPRPYMMVCLGDYAKEWYNAPQTQHSFEAALGYPYERKSVYHTVRDSSDRSARSRSLVFEVFCPLDSSIPATVVSCHACSPAFLAHELGNPGESLWMGMKLDACLATVRSAFGARYHPNQINYYYETVIEKLLELGTLPDGDFPENQITKNFLTSLPGPVE